MNKGIFFIILSGLCFTVVNFIVKLLGGGEIPAIFGEIQKYPVHELVLVRSIITLILTFIILKKGNLPVFGNNKKWLIIRGVCGTIALTIFFQTLQILPMAVASILQRLAPIFTVIFATILLGEKVKSLQWIFILMAFSGVGLIAFDQLFNSNSSEKISFFWMGLGMVAAAFSGMAYTAIRKLKDSDHPMTIVFYFPLVATPVMLILCFNEFTFPQGMEWIYLILLGLFTQFAQVFMTKALHESDASTIIPFQYLGAIYAFLIGYFVFDEQLSFWVQIGVALVIIGVISNVLLRKRKKKSLSSSR